ncbi:hypothetical protein DVH24_009977 [Malus domestica]|uniref:MCM10 OB-fold domain-containing protein n=1 Tax=Malus domestica TaxID=3750 RepID=A0A498JVZ7_MALDO|nr:hypothetical protein DVH24_009977 [Malus domestica]
MWTTARREIFVDVKVKVDPRLKGRPGCWATAGVLTEKGIPITSLNGKWFVYGNSDTISVFLFGDAYESYCKEQSGMVFALFNCTIRKDALKESQKYSSMRTELNGGELENSIKESLEFRRNLFGKTKQPLKLLSVEGLKKALRATSSFT